MNEILIIENYLSCPKLLKRLDDAEWEETMSFLLYKTDMCIYSAKQDSKNPFIEFTEHFINDDTFSKYVYPNKKIEYWVNVFPAFNMEQKGLDWHKDYEWNGDQNVHPYIGAIWYGKQDNLSGGILEIDTGSGIKTILPKYNNLVVFDTSIKHRVTPVEQGLRKSMVVSIYK
jgi:hypothetical protein